MLIPLTVLGGVAWAHAPPRVTSLCAALLTEPNFVRLGDRRLIDAAPTVRAVAGVLIPRAVSERLEVRAWSREIVGADKVAEYLESTLALAGGLDHAQDGDRGAPFWTTARKGDFAITALLPTLITGAVATEIYGFISQPDQIIYWAGPSILSLGAAVWVTKKYFVRTVQYVGALRRPQWRADVEADESPRAGATTDFLQRALADVRSENAVDVGGPAIAVPISAALARLLMDVPGLDAHPTEISNHRGLVERELKKDETGDEPKLLVVQPDLVASGPSVKFVLTATVIDMTDPAAPRPPRRGRREDERVEYGAGQPALVPIRVPVPR